MSFSFIQPNHAGLFFPRMLALAVAMSVVSSAAHAAIITVPDFVNPGQVERRLPAEPKAPSDKLQLNIPAPVESQALPEELRAKLEKTKFPLNSVLIEGATVYSS